jgi:hypothetical protein
LCAARIARELFEPCLGEGSQKLRLLYQIHAERGGYRLVVPGMGSLSALEERWC